MIWTEKICSVLVGFFELPELPHFMRFYPQATATSLWCKLCDRYQTGCRGSNVTISALLLQKLIAKWISKVIVGSSYPQFHSGNFKIKFLEKDHLNCLTLYKEALLWSSSQLREKSCNISNHLMSTAKTPAITAKNCDKYSLKAKFKPNQFSLERISVLPIPISSHWFLLCFTLALCWQNIHAVM